LFPEPHRQFPVLPGNTTCMKQKDLALISITLLLVIVVLASDPVPQDPGYHDFADQRTVLGMPNAYNVLSNELFVFIGAWGAAFTLQFLRSGSNTVLMIQYFLFFAGVFLTGLGSSYYHYAPSNQTMLWDRLPMSIAFMALLSSVITECVDRKTGAFLLAPLVVLGIFSVLYWVWTENRGLGDLRPYILVQFLPVVLIPIILLLYQPAKQYAAPVWALTTLYVVAKVFEIFDQQLYVITGIVSGHTVKHILAAAGTGVVLIMLYARRNEMASARIA